MATVDDIKSFQSATNAYGRNHGLRDLLGPLVVDGTFGDKPHLSLTHKVPLRMFFYFGGGTPTIREWDKHLTDEAIAHLTRWFRHPHEFYDTHRFAESIGLKRVAVERAKRVVRPSNGLVNFDGARVTAWVAAELQHARGHGWQGTIPDKTYGGFRTYAQQNALYQEYLNGGGIAASPNAPSNHQLKDWDGGAADCSDYDSLDRILSGLGSDLGRQGSSPDIDPVHFSSRHRYNRTGQF